MSDSWYKQANIHGFESDSIMFKNVVNIFERMEIDESINEGVVEPSYKKPTRVDSKRDDQCRKNRG